MDGGDGNDTIIASHISWYYDQESEKNTALTFTIKGGKGNDQILPYLQPHQSRGIYHIARDDIRRNIRTKARSAKWKKHQLTLSKKLLNAHYDIELGEGKDTLFLSSQEAHHAQTIIRDYNPNEDLLVFDSQKMADHFMKKISLAKQLNLAETYISYKGHQYYITQDITTNISRESKENSEDLHYPSFSSNTKIQIPYGMYKQNDLNKNADMLFLKPNLISKHHYIAQPKTMLLNEDIYLSTVERFNALHPTEALFQHKTLNSGIATELYIDFATDQSTYLETLSEDSVAAVIVEQSRQDGLSFGQNKNMLSGYSLHSFLHQQKCNLTKNMTNPSMDLRLSLILQQKDGQLVKTFI